jgi:hypothetical protein
MNPVFDLATLQHLDEKEIKDLVRQGNADYAGLFDDCVNRAMYAASELYAAGDRHYGRIYAAAYRGMLDAINESGGEKVRHAINLASKNIPQNTALPSSGKSGSTPPQADYDTGSAIPRGRQREIAAVKYVRTASGSKLPFKK